MATTSPGMQAVVQQINEDSRWILPESPQSEGRLPRSHLNLQLPDVPPAQSPLMHNFPSVIRSAPVAECAFEIKQIFD